LATADSRYRHLLIEPGEAPPTADEIAAIEAALGAALPTDFRAFLDVANGGYLEYVVDVPTGADSTEPISFCGIFSSRQSDTLETILGELASGRQYMNLPPGVLPIARDGGGSLLFLDLSPRGQGRVVAYVEGLPEWTGLRAESGLVELAPSLGAYVDLLHIDPISVEYELSTQATTVEHVEATETWLNEVMPAWRENERLVQAVASARRRVRMDWS
jgi:hypothetical protein